ncbi:type VI secretion system Vgr family protein [Niveibacterium sp. 24ML]|uniref:type VI secretion system Vgr family protein n=1 Tax=Niveibacterium sp. 24ML TaxID=2985512 RepID=UPI003B632E4A
MRRWPQRWTMTARLRSEPTSRGSNRFREGLNKWLRRRIAALRRAHLFRPSLGLKGRRGACRGEGFQLAADAWPTVRAGEGLLLTTHARPQGASPQLDANERRQRRPQRPWRHPLGRWPAYPAFPLDVLEFAVDERVSVTRGRARPDRNRRQQHHLQMPRRVRGASLADWRSRQRKARKLGAWRASSTLPRSGGMPPTGIEPVSAA